MNLLSFGLLAQQAQAANPNAASSQRMLLGLMIFFMIYIFFISRKDKKQREAEKALRDAVEVGDEIITVGGIMGRAVAVKEDSFVLESGADRNKIRFSKSAIASNVTANERLEKKKAAQAALAEKEKAEKKAAKKAKKTK